MCVKGYKEAWKVTPQNGKSSGAGAQRKGLGEGGGGTALMSIQNLYLQVFTDCILI